MIARPPRRTERDLWSEEERIASAAKIIREDREAPLLPRSGAEGDRGPLTERKGEREAIIIVGMLTDQVYPTRGKGEAIRGAAKGDLKPSMCALKE